MSGDYHTNATCLLLELLFIVVKCFHCNVLFVAVVFVWQLPQTQKTISKKDYKWDLLTKMEIDYMKVRLCVFAYLKTQIQTWSINNR